MKRAVNWLRGQAGRQWDKVGFLLSGGISSVIDYALYILLLVVTCRLDPNISVSISFIGARVISSVANFLMNKHLVFRSKAGMTGSAVKYFALATGVMAVSTLFLNIAAEIPAINPVAAKMVIDLFFFLINWMVQRYFIFK